MPVWILRSFGWMVSRVGSDATDRGGSFTIVSTNAPAASANASPNIFILDMEAYPSAERARSAIGLTTGLLSKMAGHRRCLSLSAATRYRNLLSLCLQG